MNTKWEYFKLDMDADGWRADIRIQILDIGVQNIKKIKGRNVGYTYEEYVAILHDGTQVRLGGRSQV